MSKKSKTKLVAELITLADSAHMSQGDNKLNIIGLFNNFWVAKTPTVWPKMCLVFVLRGIEEKTEKINIQIFSPNKKVLDKNVSIKFRVSGKANFITNLTNFPLESFGEYKIKLSNKGNELVAFSFTVIKRKTTSSKTSRVSN